ncbi:adenosylhomocysteinase [Mycetocola lacteus]|uniref:adenosylhomocysteinase n=1 Tax=Mycetocola lacteus TaxID=76637 RepID=UPI001FEB8A11|nr:adenosylhomocysteinase [Mycetocola lacteus]
MSTTPDTAVTPIDQTSAAEPVASSRAESAAFADAAVAAEGVEDAEPSRAELAAAGERRIAWIRTRMGMLANLRERFAAERPFEGITIGLSLHVEPKTAVLVETLAAGGARIVGTGNHGSTQDDVVAALQERGMTIFGRRDDSIEEHHRNLARTIAERPQILLDNGADLAALAVTEGLSGSLIGGTEETTSGAFRLREEMNGEVPFPVIVINDSPLKAIGENKHAVGQSAVESFMRLTNVQVPGRRFVVAGYGWCGRGIAQYLRALGGRVSVAEVDELAAYEAAFDGFRVAPLADLVSSADVIITATGRAGILTAEHFDLLRDGTILGNIGHFPWEIDVPALTSAGAVAPVTEEIDAITLDGDRTVYLLTGGRMYNLAGTAPRGNSIEAMDVGFMMQALSLERIALRAANLPTGPQPVPDDINRDIARQTLSLLGSSLA